MIVTTVNFKYVEVNKYERNYKSEDLTLRIYFNDGSQDRFVEKKFNINSNSEETTKEVLNDIKKLARESNAKGSRDFLGDAVVVRFDDDESMEDRLMHAFNRIKEDLRKIRNPNNSTGFLQNIASFQKSKYSLLND